MRGSKWRGSSGEPLENLPGIPGHKDGVWVSLEPYPQPEGLETPRWKHGSVVLCGEHHRASSACVGPGSGSHGSHCL